MVKYAEKKDKKTSNMKLYTALWNNTNKNTDKLNGSKNYAKQFLKGLLQLCPHNAEPTPTERYSHYMYGTAPAVPPT